MRNRRLASSIVIVAASVFAATCDTTLKDIVEKEFPDFTGLETALKRDHIVGLQPAVDFPNLHCCWVGDRTGWQKIADKMIVIERTEVDASATALIKAVGISISGKGSSYVEAVAKPIYRDQLINIRHLGQPHCVNHESACAKTICTNALKVGTVEVTTYTKAKAGASVSAGPKPLKVGKANIDGESYQTDTLEATDIIVGYKMAPTSCGSSTGTTWYGKDKTPSATVAQNDTYQKHLEAFQKELEDAAKDREIETAPIPRDDGRIVEPKVEEARNVLAPPPDGVISGDVIRVTTVDETLNPQGAIGGLIVQETDKDGHTETRTVNTDSHGGAWVALGAATTVVAMRLGEHDVYRATCKPQPSTVAEVRRHLPDTGGTGNPPPGGGYTSPPPSTTTPPNCPQEPPAIKKITPPSDNEIPPGIVKANGTAELRGSNFGTVTRVVTNGKEERPLAAGSNYVLARFNGTGPAQVQLRTANGLTSAPAAIERVGITVAKSPPTVLHSGQSGEVVLRLEGTERALPVTLECPTPNMRFATGARKVTVTSSGGADNLARVIVQAQETGTYRVNYELGKPKASGPIGNVQR